MQSEEVGKQMGERGRQEGSGAIDPSIVKDLKKSLKGLKPVVRERKPTLSKQTVLISLLPEIQEAKSKGYTNKQIADHLTKKGLEISLSTLVIALRKAKKQANPAGVVSDEVGGES